MIGLIDWNVKLLWNKMKCVVKHISADGAGAIYCALYISHFSKGNAAEEKSQL